MSDSILNTTKKALGLTDDYVAFDPEITMFINSTFSRLSDLGIGPEAGFEISDENDMWSTYLEGDVLMNRVKTYVYLKVRLLFDPPQTSFLLGAINEQITEMEYLINALWEKGNWTDPTAEVAV